MSKKAKSFRLSNEIIDAIQHAKDEANCSESDIVEQCVLENLPLVVIGETKVKDLFSDIDRIDKMITLLKLARSEAAAKAKSKTSHKK